MDVRVLATATRIKGGAEGEHRNVVALIEQGGEMNPPLYIVTFQIYEATHARKLTHWSRTDHDQHEARALYDQGCRDFIDVEPAEPIHSAELGEAV
jgi:hypothetical protein